MLKSLFRSRGRTPREEKRRARPALEPLEPRDLLSGGLGIEEVTSPEDRPDTRTGLIDWPASFRTLESAEGGLLGPLVWAALLPDPADERPTITGFQAVLEEGCIFTFQGRVLGDQVEGLEVRFGGLRSLVTARAVVAPGGWFSLTIRLQPGEEGTATARITDAAGRDSSLAMTLVRQA